MCCTLKKTSWNPWPNFGMCASINNKNCNYKPAKSFITQNHLLSFLEKNTGKKFVTQGKLRENTGNIISAWMWPPWFGYKMLGPNAGCQEVSRCHTRGKSDWSIAHRAIMVIFRISLKVWRLGCGMFVEAFSLYYVCYLFTSFIIVECH